MQTSYSLHLALSSDSAGNLAKVLFLPHWHSSQVTEPQNILGRKEPIMNPALK